MDLSAWALLGVFLFLLLLLAWPLAAWMHAVVDGRFAVGRRIEAPLWRLAGVDATHEQGWRDYTLGLVLFSVLGVVAVFVLQLAQGALPLNPAGMNGVAPDSAFNTAISFVTNTNWQGYAGEATMSHLTQMLALTVQNFVSAASGIAVAVALIRGFARHSAQTIGNVWVDLTRITLWLLLPLAGVFALVLVALGVIQNLSAPVEVQTLDAGTQTLAMGPVASQLAIKMLGTNGGGFFNANSRAPVREHGRGGPTCIQMLSIFAIGDRDVPDHVRPHGRRPNAKVGSSCWLR